MQVWPHLVRYLVRYVTINICRHIIFSTPVQLDYLASTKCLFVDRTFDVIKAPFTQLYSFHGFLKVGELHRHRRLQQKAQRGKLQFYLLVQLLLNEASLLPLQAARLGQGVLCRLQQRSHRLVKSNIQRYWAEYTAHQRPVTSLLRACGRLIDPM